MEILIAVQRFVYQVLPKINFSPISFLQVQIHLVLRIASHVMLIIHVVLEDAALDIKDQDAATVRDSTFKF